MFRFRLLTMLLLVSGWSAGQSQQLFQRNDRLTYTVRIGSEKPGNTDASRIIRILAEGDGQASSTFQYEIGWNQLLRVLRTSSNRLSLQVQHTDIRVRGPVKVRGFDVSSVLNPSWVDFSYQLRSQGSTAPLVYNSLKKINNGVAENTENTLVDSTTTNCTLTVTSCYFVYNEQAVRRVKDRVELIKDYYGHEILLNQAYDRVMRVNPQDALQLEMQNAQLTDVERFLHDLKERDFDGQLELVAYDPIGFRNKVQRIEQEAISRRVAINQTKANQYLFFYNMGLDFKARGRYQQAYDSFMRSIQENPLFAPSLYQLSLMDYEEGRLIESECRARTILDEMVPDPDIERMTREQLLRISDRYVELGEAKLGQGKVDESLELLNRAANLCATLRGFECNERLSGDLQRAHQAKYKELLDKARAAYQRSDLDQAERFVENALAYQQAQSRYIVSGAEALEMRKAILQKRYDQFIDAGRQLASQGNNREAVNKLLQADELQRKEGLVRSDEYVRLIRSSGRPLFMDQAALAKQSVRSNDLVRARSQAKDLRQTLTRYELSSDSSSVAALNEVNSMIFSQECANAQKSFDDLASQAGEAFDKREYIRTDDLIRKALALSDREQDCRLNEGNLRASLDSIRSAVAYLRSIEEVLSLQSKGRAAEAFDAYGRAGRQYSENGIVRFGLLHQDVDTFAYNRCNDAFMDYLVNIHIDKKEYDQALSIFRNILTRNGGKVNSAMNRTLVRLGTELGVRDKRSGAATSWKSGALRYTDGDKRLRPLEKGYKQGWKKDR